MIQWGIECQLMNCFITYIHIYTILNKQCFYNQVCYVTRCFGPGSIQKVPKGLRSFLNPLYCRTGPRGRGRDPLGQGPGPGPLGPGAWGPLGLGPRCGIRVSGRLPTVSQATYCQAKLPTVRQSYQQSGMHPTTAYMHPTEP